MSQIFQMLSKSTENAGCLFEKSTAIKRQIYLWHAPLKAVEFVFYLSKALCVWVQKQHVIIVKEHYCSYREAKIYIKMLPKPFENSIFCLN